MKSKQRIGSHYIWIGMCLILLSGCGQHLKFIETEADPTSLAIDARGQYLYIACEGAEKVMAWDLDKKAKAGEVDVKAGPLRLYLEKDNRTLHVLCQGAKAVRTYTVPEMTFLDETVLPDQPSAMLVVDDSGEKIYCSEETDQIRPYIEGNPLPVVGSDANPVDMLLQPESGLLWVANYKGGTVSVIRLEQNEIIKRIPLWPNPLRMAISPMEDKAFVLCVGQDAEPPASVIQLVDFFYQTAGLKWQAGNDARDMVLGPMGRNLYVVDEEKILIISVKTGVKIHEEKTGKNPQAIAVSPDGTKVYVSCQDEHGVRIHKLREKDLEER